MQDRENLARQLRNNQMMREQAREQIQPTQLITDILTIDVALEGNRDSAGNRIPLEKEIIAALRTRADIKFRLLSKVLPDLKATESISHNIHDHQHAHAHTTVTNMELATRLQLWRRDHGMESLPDVVATIPGEKRAAEPVEDVEVVESCPEATFSVEDFL